MTSSSPSVTRVVAILNFLADHPERSFNLTELVRALKISRATCHSVLLGLVEAGYVYRTADKTYSLGNALARIAAVASSSGSRLQAASSEMRKLSDDLDVICALIVREGNHAVVRDRAISRSHIGWNIPVLGSRMALDLPLGGAFYAWGNKHDIDRWFNSADKPLEESTKAELLQRLEIAHKRGYSFNLRLVPIEDEHHARALVYEVEKSEYLIGEIEPDKIYPLASIEAPVLEQDGEVSFMIALMGFTRGVNGTSVEKIGAKLREACKRIEAISG